MNLNESGEDISITGDNEQKPDTQPTQPSTGDVASWEVDRMPNPLTGDPNPGDDEETRPD